MDTDRGDAEGTVDLDEGTVDLDEGTVDLDEGTASEETVEFGLDGVVYEIDLAPADAARLRQEVGRWAAQGRRCATAHRA